MSATSYSYRIYSTQKLLFFLTLRLTCRSSLVAPETGLNRLNRCLPMPTLSVLFLYHKSCDLIHDHFRSVLRRAIVLARQRKETEIFIMMYLKCMRLVPLQMSDTRRRTSVRASIRFLS